MAACRQVAVSAIVTLPTRCGQALGPSDPPESGRNALFAATHQQRTQLRWIQITPNVPAICACAEWLVGVQRHRSSKQKEIQPFGIKATGGAVLTARIHHLSLDGLIFGTRRTGRHDRACRGGKRRDIEVRPPRWTRETSVMRGSGSQSASASERAYRRAATRLGPLLADSSAPTG